MESNAFTAVLEEQTGKLAEELTTYANRPVVIELRSGKETKNIGSSGRNATKVTLNAAAPRSRPAGRPQACHLARAGLPPASQRPDAQ